MTNGLCPMSDKSFHKSHYSRLLHYLFFFFKMSFTTWWIIALDQEGRYLSLWTLIAKDDMTCTLIFIHGENNNKQLFVLIFLWRLQVWNHCWMDSVLLKYGCHLIMAKGFYLHPGWQLCVHQFLISYFSSPNLKKTFCPPMISLVTLN